MPSEREAGLNAGTETMLAVAEPLGISVDALAFLAHRFEQRLGMLDAAEPGPRAGLERVVAEDFEELATAFKVLRRVVVRMPTA